MFNLFEKTLKCTTLFMILFDYFLFVFIPSSVYNGQKLIKLVRIKIPETTSSIIAIVPERILVKYKIAIITAIAILIALSIVPILFFMIF